MRKVLAFVLLAGLGVGLLVWTSGGFLGPGSVGDRPAVEVGEDARGPAGMELPSFDPEAPQTRLLETDEGPGESRPAGMRRIVARSWTDAPSGERFEFPHFLQWTLEVENVKPFLDADTGRQGFRYERVRIRLYRDPANRAEAEAMRDDPSFRLLQLEIDAAGGTGTWNLRGGVPERPVVRLTRSARLRDHVRSLTVLCDDVVVDLDEESAEGAGDVVAEHPACFLRGRGMRLDDGGSRFEILAGADVRVHSDKEARGGRSPLAGGSMRPTRLHAVGGAVVTTLPPTEGKGYRVDVERAVNVEQVDGPTLQADVAQIVVVEAPDPDGRAGEKAYQLRSFIATGDVKVERRQEGGDAPSLLSVFCDRLVHDATARGPGRTLLEGDCRATYRGDFSTAGGPPTRGLVRLSSRRSMALGPPTDEQPGAHLQLTLEGSAVVERTEASGEDAADRVEAERLVLLLGRRAGGGPAAGGGMLDSDPGDLEAIGFSATGGVRLDGPRVVGSATTIVGVDLHRPEFRLIADGDPHFDVASAAAREGGGPGAPGGGASGGPAGAGGAGGGDRKDWRLDWLRASGDVAATLRGGNGAMRLEGDALAFDERTGAVLERKAGGAAWLTLPGGGADERVEARWIGFDPVRGEVTTRGRTVATVRVGGTRSPARAAPTDRVVVRGGARIQVEGKRAPGVEYRVRIEGGGSIETVGVAGVVDRLRADEIEAGIGEARGAAGSPLFGGSPAAAKTAPAAPAEAAAPAKASTRWTLECDEGIVARLSPGAGGGVGDLRSFQASGGVVAKTDEQRVDGESLSYDAAAGVLTIDGTPAESARLRLGAGDEAPRAWSPSVRVTLRDGKPVQATLSAPSTVLLFRATGEGGAAARTERIELRSEGPLELAAQGAETRGRTALKRSERAKAGEPFGEASTLFTPHLVVEADRLLGGGKTEVRRLLARGPGTRFEHGDPAGDGLALLGESITYDAVAQVVHVEGAGGVRVLRKDGPTSAKSFTYDVARKLLDFERPRIEIGGR